MDLKDYRVQMDDIDNQLIDLFRKRMETAGAIAAYKKEHGLPVLDAGREREKMRTPAGENAPGDAQLHQRSLLLPL